MGLIAFVFVLGVIVAIHELGHLIFAKKAGILCHEYAVGMGPVLYSKKKNETVYSLRLIPLGGFVSMAGEEINNALFKVGDIIGLKLEEGKVKYIHFNNVVGADYTGSVVDFELYGENGEELFITLNISGEDKRFVVLEDALYKFDEKKELQISPYNRSFDSKSFSGKFMTIIMGPAMNFILAFFLFMFVGAFPIVDNKNVVIGSIDGSLGNGEVLKLKDEIKGISFDGGSRININSWDEFSDLVNKNKGSKSVAFFVNRNNEEKEINVSPSYLIYTIGLYGAYDGDNLEIFPSGKIGDIKINKDDKVYITKVDGKEFKDWKELMSYFESNEFDSIKKKDNVELTLSINGVEKTTEMPFNSNKVLGANGIDNATKMLFGIEGVKKINFINFLTAGFVESFESFSKMFKTLGVLFAGEAKISQLSGPIGIYSLTADVAKKGFISLLSFMAFLSINVGFLNLLPIPALDGGRIAIMLGEKITGKKMKKELENKIILVTFILLLALIIYISYNDILRLIGVR